MARIEKWDEVHGNQALDEKMMAFLDSTTDQYAILQLRRSEDTVYERFSSMRELERMGLEPDIDHYEVVYTAPASSLQGSEYDVRGTVCEIQCFPP